MNCILINQQKNISELISRVSQFHSCTDTLHTKHSFLRELREVAPEMELFPENHSPYEKDFVTKSNPYAKFSARHFTKKIVS